MKRKKGLRAIAILAAVLMVVTMIPNLGHYEVYAANSVIDDYNRVMGGEEPDNYSDETFEPYGYGEDVPFFMNKQSELLFYQTSPNSSGDITTFYDRLNSASTGDVLGGTKTKAMKAPPAKLKKAYFVQAVAFDPTGSGRDDHIAFIGVYYGNSHARCYVWAYDTKRQSWTSEFDIGTRRDTDCRWMLDEDVTEYEAANFISITAGDYDGDGKDTLVAYCAMQDVYGYSIYELDCRNPDFKVQYHGNSFEGRNLANDQYGSDLCVDEHIKTKMACELDTGDINGDNIDDLVVLSYIGNHDDKTRPLETYRPMVKFAYGAKGKVGITNDKGNAVEAWSWEEGWWFNSMVSPGISVGDVDNDGKDEIVAAGISCDQKKKSEYTCERIFDDIDESKLFVCIIGTGDNNKAQREFTTKTGTNAWTRSGFYEGDKIWNKTGVQCVATNGVGNAEQIFISGTIFKYDSKNNKLSAAYTPDYFQNDGDNLSDKASTNMFIQSTAAGNFDGNSKSYEQVAFTVSCKTQSKRSYDYLRGVIGGKEFNNTTGIARSYYSTSMSKMNDSYAWPGKGKDNASGYISEQKGLNCIVVGADCDNDGVLARYKDKALIYSDPEVLCVLQAPPFFKEVEEYCTDSSSTSYEIEESYAYDRTTSDSVSYGVGVVAGMESPAVQMELSAGYALDWTNEFSEGHETTVTLGWNAKGEDIVLVQRKPVVSYYYEIQSKDGSWNGECVVVTVPCEPGLVDMGVDEYNAFATYYNKTLTDSQYLKDYHKKDVPDYMKEYHKLGLLNNQWLGHAGEPDKYIKYSNSLFKTDSRYEILQKTAVSMGHNSESATWGKSQSNSVGETEQMSHGFTYDATIAMGPNIGPASLYVGLTTSLQYMTGESVTTTHTTKTGISCEVNGLKVKDMPESMRGNEYNFKFKMARWPSGLKHYVNGVAEDVPVYGYALSGVTRPSEDESVSVEDQLKAAEVIEMISELPAVEDITLEDESAVNVIRAKYDALSDSAKTLVDLSDLVAIESRIELLKNSGMDITDAAVKLSQTSFTYNGKTQKPVIKTINGYTLIEGLDYKVSWSSSSSKNAGTYTMLIEGIGLCSGSTQVTYKIKQISNKLSIKAKTYTVKYSKLKKKNQVLTASKLISFKNKGQGTLKYKLVGVTKSKYKKYFKVDAKTGKLTIKKKLKKGTYKVKISVTAAGSTNYKPATKLITATIKVK